MASIALKGNWQLLLLGFLLSTSPILVAANTTAIATTGATYGPTTTSPSLTAVTNITAQTTANGTTNATNPTQVTSSAATVITATTSVPPFNTGSTSAPISTATGASPSSVSSSSVATSSATSSPMPPTSTGNYTGGQTNGTTGWGNFSMSKISCPSFMCNYSDCYSMYMSQNATACPAGYSYCELIRQMGVCYTVSCSVSCSMSCGNTSQSNCSVNCCNSTNCLNGTFASMMGTTTTPAMTMTTTTSPTTVTTLTVPTTQGGNKCRTGKCNGTDCYKTFTTAQVCSSSQPHCQLKKETVGTSLQWTAGCTTNCSGQTSCQASTQPPCQLECCNATVASCLWLNGTLNVPSFATRGPQLHSQLVTSVLVVFAISLML